MEAPVRMREAVLYSNLSADTLRRYVDRGLIKGVRIGGQRRIYMSSIDALFCQDVAKPSGLTDLMRAAAKRVAAAR